MLGVIGEDDLKKAKNAAQQDGIHPTSYFLIRMNLVKKRSVLIDLFSKHYGVKGIDLANIEIDEKIVRLIDAELAARHNVIPIERDGNKIRIAMSNPRDLSAIDAVEFATQLMVEPLVSDPFSIKQRIDRGYNQTEEQIQKLLLELDEDMEAIFVVDEEEEEDKNDLQDEIDEAPVVKLVNNVITDAVRRGASDIHIETFENQLRIRFRVDGVLVEIARPPVRLARPVLSKIKLLSNLDPAIKRLPQDGRMKIRMGNRVVDFRVSTIPTAFGEKAVLRILDKSAINLNLEQIGIDERGLEIIVRTLLSPYGMIVATGPTGSGKTTTLYSMLMKLNGGELNILTVEDPIEYDLPGINQLQVRHNIGLTFASALRAFLRQDPDVVMVGEMRDHETAEIAVQAALTGHMVLSTVHTNDAATAFARLIELGVEKFNVANAMSTVIAQRLVRTVCPKCAQTVKYKEEYLRFAQLTDEDIAGANFKKGRGCQECDGIGYVGRIGLFEVLPVTSRIRHLIMNNASAEDIREAARAEGMMTLREIGLEKARQGITTLEEVIKHTNLA